MRMIFVFILFFCTSVVPSYSEIEYTDFGVISPHEPASKKKLRKDVVTFARKYLGSGYGASQYGKYAFDCSGFVNHVYSNFGVKLARSSSDIAHFNGKKTQYPQPGDLVFFMVKGRINHVALVSDVDKGKIYMVHSTSSKGVVEECLSESDYWLNKLVFFNEVI